MRTATRFRQAPPPARAAVRWLHRFHAGVGAIAINDVPYAVAELREQGRLVGYRLARHCDDGEIVYYDISNRFACWECSCPDFIFRRDGHDERGCKHIQAVRAAVAVDRGIRLYQPKGGGPFVP